MQSLHLPDSITAIGKHAFENCEGTDAHHLFLSLSVQILDLNKPVLLHQSFFFGTHDR